MIRLKSIDNENLSNEPNNNQNRLVLTTYPNPSSNNALLKIKTIDIDELNIIFTDSSGKVLEFIRDTKNVNDFSEVFDISSLEDGVVYYNARTSKGIFSGIMVKQSKK
ncbi:MAG: T9SS type A sorting domain-containing protein [Bacteroidota bacterium]